MEQNVNSSLVDLLANLNNFKRNAYSSLDQALSNDQANQSHPTPAGTTNVIDLYEKSSLLIEKALNYYKRHKELLDRSDNGIKIYNQLNSMRLQTNLRLNDLKNGITSDSSSPHLNEINDNYSANDDDVQYLDLSDDILLVDDDDIIVIEEESVPPPPPPPPPSSNSNSTQNKPTSELTAVVYGSPESNNKTSKITRKASQLLNDCKKASEIFSLENAVQLFYIATDGGVSTPSTPTTLHVYTFDEASSTKHSNKDKNIVGFIKAGDWMHPLIPDGSPGMKTNYDAYIFPNANQELDKNVNNNTAKCSFVGLTFTKSVDKDQIGFFEDIMANYGSLIYQNKAKEKSAIKKPTVVPPSTAAAGDSAVSSNGKISNKESSKNIVGPSDKTPAVANKTPKEKIAAATVDDDDKSKEESNKEDDSSSSQINSTWSAENIAEKLIVGANYVSRGVSSVTEYATKYMQTGSEKLKSQLEPNPQPAKVDPTVKSAAQNIRYGSHVTVRVSSYLLNKLGSFTQSAAKTVAPHIRKGSVQLLTKTGLASGSNANSYVDDICTVASSSLQSASIVYDSLEDAAKTLAKNFTDHSVHIVKHKYGEEAAKVTENSLYSVGNVAVTANNFKNFKVFRTLAKETAKEAIHHNSSAIQANPSANNNNNNELSKPANQPEPSSFKKN